MQPPFQQFTSSLCSMFLQNPHHCLKLHACCVLSCFSCVQLSATPWTIARQAPLSMGFSRQEYWSGLPGTPPRDRHDPGIEFTSLHLLYWQMDSLPLSHMRSPILSMKVKESEGAQSCLTLCDPIDCSLPYTVAYNRL